MLAKGTKPRDLCLILSWRVKVLVTVQLCGGGIGEHLSPLPIFWLSLDFVFVCVF